MGFLNDCWKDFFSILVALGSIGTFGAFLLLFKKDREKQRQIDMLTKIAKIDEKRLKYQAAPMLWLNGASSRPLENLIKIDLNNKGKRANLDEFEAIEGDFDLPSKSLPYQLEEGERRYIFIRPNSSHVNQTYYKIKVYYRDDVGTQYLAIVEGTGTNVRLISNTEIE